MTSKITLRVDKSIIERAEAYAKSRGKSLSELIESYLETIIEDNENAALSPKLKKIVGVVKLPKNFDENKERSFDIENKGL